MSNDHQSSEDERRDQRRWHLDKRLNVGHLLTTLTIAAAVFIWASKVDTRISLLEQTVSTWVLMQDKRDGMQDEQLRRLANETLENVRSINNKMERLVEREIARNGKR